MKTTIEVPDELFRKVKAKAALQNVRIKELVTALLERWINERAPAPPGEPDAEARRRVEEMDAWLAEWQRIGTEIEQKSVDPRSMVEILNADRR
jgi:hypothetical protein